MESFTESMLQTCFSIAVTSYLLFRLEWKLDEMKESFNRLASALTIIIERREAKS